MSGVIYISFVLLVFLDYCNILGIEFYFKGILSINIL